MLREIRSPKSDIAKDEMVAIEEANVQIKETIISGIQNGTVKADIEKRIKEIIAETLKSLKSLAVKQMFEKGIKASAQRWFMIYKDAVKVATIATVGSLSKLGIQARDISVEYGLSEKFRPFVANNPKGLPIIEDYQRRIRQAVNVLAVDNPTATIETIKGPRRASLRNTAETTIRYEENLKDIERLKEEGVGLVITTTHADCSKRCERFQGKIFTLEDEPVVVNGKKYYPLKWAMQGENKDGNGIISGYNCRHRTIEYKPGMVMPTEYNKAEIRKQRKINSKERYLERQVREYKVKEKLYRDAGFKKEAKKVRLKWREKQEQYKIFCLENGNPYEEWRCRISNEEKEQILKTNDFIDENRKKELIAQQIIGEPKEINKNVIKVINEPYKTEVILMKERYEHIVTRHEELKGKENEILESAYDPDLVIKDNSKEDYKGQKETTYTTIKNLDDGHSIVTTIKYVKLESKKMTSIITSRVQNTNKLYKSIEKKQLEIVFEKKK